MSPKSHAEGSSQSTDVNFSERARNAASGVALALGMQRVDPDEIDRHLARRAETPAVVYSAEAHTSALVAQDTVSIPYDSLTTEQRRALTLDAVKGKTTVHQLLRDVAAGEREDLEGLFPDFVAERSQAARDAAVRDLVQKTVT